MTALEPDDVTEVSGALFLAFGQACADLHLFLDADAQAFLAAAAPDQFYPLARFDALLATVRAKYVEPEPILEQIGYEMMHGWYAHVGHTLVSSSLDFLRFQTGSQGYDSVIRGPREVVGAFALTSLDESAGTATVTSSTPLSREMECGVLRGGMTAAGKLGYLDVTRDGDLFSIRFAVDAPADLVAQGLAEQLARRERFWTATNRTIARAIGEIRETAAQSSRRPEILAGDESDVSDAEARALATQPDERRYATVVEWLPGQEIEGRYVIHERIGSGAHSIVHRARHLFLDRDVALKLLRVTGKLSPRTLARFRQEGAAACRLQHPAAVTVLDSGVFDNGLPYLVMELLVGADVAAVSDDALPAGEAIAIARPVAEMLAVAAERGLVHRDIKPANVFLHRTGGDGRSGKVEVKVLDFGLAKMLDDSDPLGGDMTQQGAIVGTPAYIAPERLEGRPFGPPVDVFSLGVLLYRLLAGRLPFTAAGGSLWELLEALKRCEPAPLTSPCGELPEGLCELVMSMLAREPERRPQADEVAARLAEMERSTGEAGADLAALVARTRRGPVERHDSSTTLEPLPDSRSPFED